MLIDLTEEQALLRDTCRQFAARELTPNAKRWDREHRFPAEALKKCAELGLFGVDIPTEEGGAGMDAISYALAIEEISRGCASTGVTLSAHNSLYCDPLLKFGTAAQKERWLKPFARGEKLGCFGLTEPQAGSDAAEQKTQAVRKGAMYVINGTKNWITNGPVADAIVLFTITDATKGVKGITAFVVDTDTPGFLRQKADEKLGICASPSCTIFFESMEVPVSQRLGKEGDGFKIAMSALDGGRIGIAAQAIGIARGAYEEARDYAKVRKTFDVPIAQHQAIQFMLADMATELDAARLLTLRAAALKDNGVRHTRESSMAKLYASEMSGRVTDKAIQIHGGMGYSKELDIERHFRDARITEIYEGTSEIQRLIISNALLK
ncbi:MAG TPA: acyl-CoA dehydrogenase [Myxococcales bacterium]|jgi:butyryl-CoA dehydrogenase|nr:acyl-CoA dehydrogenase [Myxococcales bacterium]